VCVCVGWGGGRISLPEFKIIIIFYTLIIGKICVERFGPTKKKKKNAIVSPAIGFSDSK